MGAARLRAAMALLAFSLGIAISWNWNGLPGSGVLFGGALLLAGISLVLGRNASACAMFVSIVCFGAGWGALRLRERSVESLGALLTTGETCILRVMLVEAPRRTGEETGWTALAECSGIVTDEGDVGATGKVWLRVPGEIGSRRVGDRLIVRGSFRPVGEPGNPGEFDLERWARDRGIEGSFRALTGSMTRPDESGAGLIETVQAWRLKGIAALRSRAGAVLEATSRGASDETRDVLRGLLLGENPREPSGGLRAFYRLGLAHILSISGFHLVVFAGAVMIVLRLFGDLGKIEPLLIGLAIVLFLAMVPPSSPLVRAAAILLTLLVAEFFGRRYDRLTLLCWVAIGVLLVRPSELWSLGFQLSFGLAAALLGLSNGLLERLFPMPLGQRASERGIKRWLVRGAQALFVTGLLCWGLSAPWIAAQIGIFNPIAVVTGFLVTPLIAVILWIGYGVLLVGIVMPGAGGIASTVLSLLSDVCVGVVLWFDSLPGATVRLPWLSSWWAGAASLLLAYWFWRARLRARWCLVIACVLGVWGAGELLFAKRLPDEVVSRVHVLDVDRGTCVLARTPERAVMIGAGTSSGGRELPVIARELGAWRLDALVLRVGAGGEKSLEGGAEVIRTLLPRRVVVIGEGERKGQAWEAIETEARLFRIPVEMVALAEPGRLGVEEAWLREPVRKGMGMLTVETLRDGSERRSVWRRSGPISQMDAGEMGAASTFGK